MIKILEERKNISSVMTAAICPPWIWKISDNKDEIKDFADEWLGKQFINHQTGEEAKPLNAIMIADSTTIEKGIVVPITAIIALIIEALSVGGLSGGLQKRPVSYTHLTLPTIYSV